MCRTQAGQRKWKKLPVHLIRRSFEDAGALIDGVGQEAVLFVLQLLRCPVQGLGDSAALRDVTLDSREENKNTISTQ